MKQHMKSLILATLTVSSFHLLAADKFPAGKYDVDSAHSKVGFEIPHLVISSVEGKFTDFNGKLDLSEKFTQSKLEATVELKSIDTGVTKRDDHLRSADFFDVAKTPKMTFKSKSIEGTPENFKIKGDLTIKGKTRPVIFEGKYLGAVVDGYGNQKVAFQATTKIDRKDFGLTWNSVVEAGPVVGDQVTIELKIQAGRPLPKAAAVNGESRSLIAAFNF